jgi:hypothetical protein
VLSRAQNSLRGRLEVKARSEKSDAKGAESSTRQKHFLNPK